MQLIVIDEIMLYLIFEFNSEFKTAKSNVVSVILSYFSDPLLINLFVIVI